MFILEFNKFQKESEELAGVVLKVNNLICLVLPKKYKGENMYSIPKGKIEGTNIKHNAYREFREETGINLGLTDHDNSFKYTYKKNGVKKILHLYVVEMNKEDFSELEISDFDTTEISDVKLMGKGKALESVEPQFKKLIRYIYK